MRIDQYLVAKGYFDSRNKAANAVKSGCFTVNGKGINKPSVEISERDVVERISDEKIYVARSAHKLLRAFREFGLHWEGYVVADLGASTGGFCQVLLENGVSRVFAVDIGTAQLHIDLKNHPKIVNMEHTNARYLTADSFPEQIDAVTADLSFISIKAVLPAIYQVLPTQGAAVVLVKPQFEAGPPFLNKKGVVHDKKIQRKVVEEVALFAENIGFGVQGVSFSGLSGESGNREYLLYLVKDIKTEISINSAVEAAVNTEEYHA